MHKKINIEYFAVLSQEAGKAKEELATRANTVEELFDELKQLYHFSLSEQQVKITLNNQFVSSWKTTISAGDHILLLVPLAGG